MCQWDGIDAIYVATPTSVKEEITIAAAKAGKHVLCEKPLPSLAATQRMLAACRENNVAFMDGTHFSHHPRSIEIENKLDTLVGKRRTLHCVFQFNIRDKSNIRMIPALEPMGVVGDAGWYNMRGIVDYLPANVELKDLLQLLAALLMPGLREVRRGFLAIRGPLIFPNTSVTIKIIQEVTPTHRGRKNHLLRRLKSQLTVPTLLFYLRILRLRFTILLCGKSGRLKVSELKHSSMLSGLVR